MSALCTDHNLCRCVNVYIILQHSVLLKAFQTANYTTLIKFNPNSPAIFLTPYSRVLPHSNPHIRRRQKSSGISAPNVCSLRTAATKLVNSPRAETDGWDVRTAAGWICPQLSQTQAIPTQRPSFIYSGRGWTGGADFRPETHRCFP